MMAKAFLVLATLWSHSVISSRVSEAKVLAELRSLTLSPTPKEFCEKITGHKLVEISDFHCNPGHLQGLPPKIAQECAQKLAQCRKKLMEWETSAGNSDKVGPVRKMVLGEKPDCSKIWVSLDVEIEEPQPSYWDCSETGQLWMRAACSRGGNTLSLAFESTTYSHEDDVKLMSKEFLKEKMTVEAAMRKCAFLSQALRNATRCTGFTFQGRNKADEEFMIYFMGVEKSSTNYLSKGYGGAGWTSFYADRGVTHFYAFKSLAPTGTLEPTDMMAALPTPIACRGGYLEKEPCTVRLQGDPEPVAIVSQASGKELKCQRKP